jgi:hypothetical protein
VQTCGPRGVRRTEAGRASEADEEPVVDNKQPEKARSLKRLSGEQGGGEDETTGTEGPREGSKERHRWKLTTDPKRGKRLGRPHTRFETPPVIPSPSASLNHDPG